MAALALFCRFKDSSWILISLSCLARVHGQFRPALPPEHTCSSPIFTPSSSGKPITTDKHVAASHWSLSFLSCPCTTDPSGSSQGDRTKSPSSGHLLCLNPRVFPLLLEQTQPLHQSLRDPHMKLFLTQPFSSLLLVL